MTKEEELHCIMDKEPTKMQEYVSNEKIGVDIADSGDMTFYASLSVDASELARAISADIAESTMKVLAKNYGYEKVTHCWLCRYFETEYSYKEDRGQGMIETIKEPPGCSKFKIDLANNQGYCSFAEPLF